MLKKKPNLAPPELMYHHINCLCKGYNFDERCAELTRSVEDAIDNLLR